MDESAWFVSGATSVPMGNLIHTALGDGFFGSGARNRSRNWVRVALHGAEVGGFGRVGLWGWEFVACLLLGFTMFNPTYGLSRGIYYRIRYKISIALIIHSLDLSAQLIGHLMVWIWQSRPSG